ncbi:uncharacterized protein CTRU02_208278 [Colletotrichum truncatum]|uniref:Uncharacterized protein n=1 Tax=Colletotrichum truncatum TaxID=5467 RepID=A0ACC3YVU1_COLTU|nr:uncharacterized protein CTRU02_07543 [Colletotrichum truncatum]KAF6791203.1 hypothetical protein CTRU02_07543 [Colletotrichum truncatum]
MTTFFLGSTRVPQYHSTSAPRHSQKTSSTKQSSEKPQSPTQKSREPRKKPSTRAITPVPDLQHPTPSPPETTTVKMSSPTKNTVPPATSTNPVNLSNTATTTNPNNYLNTANTNKSISNDGSGKSLPMPGLSGSANGPVGNLLRGPVDENGKLKDAGLMVGIKLDLEAEVHLTARVRGDILIGLY